MTAQEVAVLRYQTEKWAERDYKRRTWKKPFVRGCKAWLLVDLALSTGLRVSELADIQVEDIDFGRNFIGTWRRKKKSPRKVKRPIMVDPRVMAHIKRYLGGRAHGLLFLGQGTDRPMKAQAVSKFWKSIVKRAGLPHYSIHAARHTVGHHLLRKTRNLRIVQKQLGHSSPQITANIYADVSDEDMLAAISDLYGNGEKQEKGIEENSP